MTELITVLLVGLVGGFAVGLQGPIAGGMSQRVGGAASSFIVHLSGTVFSGLLLLGRGGENLRDWRRLPWYMLGSGILGLVLYLTINVTLPRLGAAMMTALIITGQLMVTLLIDHYGLFGSPVHPISAARVMGVLVLMLGGYLIVR